VFSDKMVTPAIPERIFTLCKIVEKKPISITDLKDKMEPDFLNNNTVYFSDYRNAAKELKLISISDNMVSLAVEPSVIKTINCMRQYINCMLEQFKDGQFYQVTSAYFSNTSKVLNGETNVSDLAPEMSRQIGRKVDPMEMRAWRFWVSFLGFGYLHNMFFIPNADVLLMDLIRNADFEKEKRYSFGEFIEKIRPECNIIIDNVPSNRELNYGVSNGLRTLHDSGYIKMEHIMDQDIWNLYPLNGHAITSTVTNITICN
jgi:hypothetical protein